MHRAHHHQREDADESEGEERRPLIDTQHANATNIANANTPASHYAAAAAAAASAAASSADAATPARPSSSALSSLHVNLPHHRGHPNSSMMMGSNGSNNSNSSGGGGGGGGGSASGSRLLLPASMIPLTSMGEDGSRSGGGGANTSRLAQLLRRGSLGSNGNLSVGSSGVTGISTGSGVGTISAASSPRDGSTTSLLFGSSALLLTDPTSNGPSRATSNNVAGGGGGANQHHQMQQSAYSQHGRRPSLSESSGNGSNSNRNSANLRSYARQFVSWITSDTPRAPATANSNDHSSSAASSSAGAAVPSDAELPSLHFSHSPTSSDEDAIERGEHHQTALSTFSLNFNNVSPKKASSSGSTAASAESSPEEPVSATGACFSHTIWLSFGLVLLFLVVFLIEYRTDSAERSSRLALLGVSANLHAPHVHVDSTNSMQLQLATSSIPGALAGSSLSSSDPHDSLISLHESAVDRQKELNKHLLALADRESKIHFLTNELSRTNRVMDAYKRIVLRLKTLQEEHAEMERRVAAENQKQIAAQQASETLFGAGNGGGGGGSSNTPSSSPSVSSPTTPLTPVDLAKYRSRLLDLIFGNKTLDESRREQRDSSLLGGVSQHNKEITALVEREKESAARRSASEMGSNFNFLARAANKLAGGGGADQTQVAVESVMRVQELEGHLGAAGGESDEENAQNAAGRAAAEGSSEHAAWHAGGGVDDSPDDPSSPLSSLGGSSPSSASSPSKSKLSPADKLVDSDKNEYILSKPGGGSEGASGAKTVDTRLVMDLGIVIIASALGGLGASLCRQPILLGYLLGGSLIGPGGLKLIGQFIQIETLSQFGATFLLFSLGVEFNMNKLRKVKHIALYGGGLQLFGIIAFVSLIGTYYFELRLKQTVFIGSILSMSSTTIVVKSLMETKQIATLCGQVMLGLLIIQDISLSLILALLNLSRVPVEHLASESVWLFVRFLFLASIVLVCMYLWPLVLKLLDSSRSHDLFLLGLVALCIFLTVISERIIHSTEIGAFLSGILISSAPKSNVELTAKSLRIFAPIRDMFGALFFSSIGMLINPAFLWTNAVAILGFVALTILVKSLVTFAIVKGFGYSWEISLRTSLGLSQIGEFAFVLASEGLSVGLVSREIYFMLLGTTAVSLCVTPFILKSSIWIVKHTGIQDSLKTHAQGVQVD